jgi:dihydrofolate reductase
MTKIYTGASVSLDGYISGPDESGFEHLFKWYGNGDVEMEMGGMPLKMSEASTRHVKDNLERTGALIVGRKLFDHTSGWGGKHPMGVPVAVVSHSVPEGWEREGEWFTFADSIESAVEKASEIADGKIVGVNGGTIASQCLDAGLLDEVWVDLVPVILGAGTPYFSSLGAAPHVLEGPISVTEGLDVTHLRYRVVRG